MRKSLKLGRRALTMLLAFAILLPIVPQSILAVDESSIDVSDMEIGKRYCARFDYTEADEFIPYKASEQEGEEGLLQWKGYWDNVPEEDAYVPKNDFPQNLIVERISEDDLYYVRVTNEDWPAEYNEYRFVSVWEIIIIGAYVPPENDEGYIEGQVGLVMDGKPITQLTIGKGEKTYVFTELGSAIQGTPGYQWQILVDKEENRWANVMYMDTPYATLSGSFLTNACDAKTSTAVIRCIATSGEKKYVSDMLNVSVVPDSVSNAMSGATGVNQLNASGQLERLASTARAGSVYALSSNRANRLNASDQVEALALDEAFQIQISYVYWNNSPVAHDIHGEAADGTFTVTILPSVSYDSEKRHPDIPGYQAYIRDDTATANYREYTALENKSDPNSTETHRYVEAEPIVFDHETEGRKIQIYYLPKEVSFTVNHYLQNLGDDEYTHVHTTFETGFSDYPVGEGLVLRAEPQFADDPYFYADMVGFNALYYDPNTRISANGNTVVNVYYDRNYYLVDFDLAAPDGNKGYGVMPLYVRYGTNLLLGTPTSPGYVFDSWLLDKVYTRTEVEENGSIVNKDTEINDASVRNLYANGAAMLTIQHNLRYVSNWTPASTTYTVAYWLQDAEKTADLEGNQRYGYSVWKTVIKSDKNPGSYITAADITAFEAVAPFEIVYSGASEKLYFTYNSEKTTSDFTSQDDYTDSGVLVKGDGSTIINVYYDRNDYELRFYYAMTGVSGSTTSHYVVGGSTYAFGATATISDKSNEVALIDYYMGSNAGQRGQINALPTYDNDDSCYASGYEPSTVNGVSYQYHYIKFTAKYGSKIGSLWPVDVFSSVTRTNANTHGKWSNTTAFVSAWNGEHNVYYSQYNSNQTIKGAYQILDYTLLWDYSQYGTLNGVATNESKTVSYMCYWLNGANVSWSIPSLFEYYIHLPNLDGTGETITMYDTYDNFNPTDDRSAFYANHKHPSIEGFTKSGSITWEELQNTNAAYQGAYRIHFRYTRNSHVLTFDDQYTRPPKKESVLFGTDLSQYADYVPDYPSSLEVGAYTFGGWYIDEACTSRFSFNTQMPDKDVYLYAKWIPTYWNVKIYEEDPSVNAGTPLLKEISNIQFGTILAGQEPKRTPPEAGYIFAGWYYKNGQEELRFDFNTMPIKHAYTIYAKWTSEVPVPYTVRYVTIVDGAEVEIAEPTTGVSLAGTSKSFLAKVDKELGAGYQTGYFPISREQTKLMETGDNVVTFEYVASESIDYRIKHVFTSQYFNDIIGKETIELVWVQNVTRSDSALLEISFDGLITWDSVQPKLKALGYTNPATIQAIWEEIIILSPDALSQRLLIEAYSTVEDNEVLFNWVGRSNKVIYEVQHYYQELDGSYKMASVPQSFQVIVGDPIGDAIYEQSPVKGFAFKEYRTNNDDPTSLKLRIPGVGQEGLIIKVYYDREVYSYTVKHRDDSMYTPIAADETYTVPYGTVLSISALSKTIEGYQLSNGFETVEIILDGQNVICYYTRESANFLFSIDGVGGSLSNYAYEVKYNETPAVVQLYIADGYVMTGWQYKVDDGEWADVTDLVATVSANGTLIQPATITEQDTGKVFHFKATLVSTSLEIHNLGLTDNGQGTIYIFTNKVSGAFVRVAVVGNNSKTVKGMPVGEYTVTVDEEWSWRYSEANATYDGELQNDSAWEWTLVFNGNGTVTFRYTDSKSNYVSDSTAE